MYHYRAPARTGNRFRSGGVENCVAAISPPQFCEERSNSQFSTGAFSSTLLYVNRKTAIRGNPYRLGVVILAAGKSGRMGRPKLLLPWGETTILGRQTNVWRQWPAVRQVAVVCAAADEAMQAELDRLKVAEADRIFNPRPEQGMFSSIRCAAQWSGWKAELTHWAISLGDQPQLRSETLTRLLETSAARPEKICQPQYQGRARHPVLLPKSLYLQLRETGAETLKEFLETSAAQVVTCEVDDPGLNFDIDTPADYERVLAAFLRPR